MCLNCKLIQRSVRKNDMTVHAIIKHQLRLILGQGLKSAYPYFKIDVTDDLHSSNVEVCIIGLLDYCNGMAWHVF